jgi:hypothetical protein
MKLAKIIVVTPTTFARSHSAERLDHEVEKQEELVALLPREGREQRQHVRHPCFLKAKL